MNKKKRKSARKLNEAEKLELATKVMQGKMLKQVAAEFNIHYSTALMVVNELLEWKLEWRIKQ